MSAAVITQIGRLAHVLFNLIKDIRSSAVMLLTTRAGELIITKGARAVYFYEGNMVKNLPSRIFGPRVIYYAGHQKYTDYHVYAKGQMLFWPGWKPNDNN